MRESGLVVKSDSQKATVRLDKKSECASCGMCLFPKNANSIEFSVDNTVGAKEGDTVIIERREETKLLGALLAFLVPLILIGLSVFITYQFIGKEIWILFLSVIFILLWYTILAIIDKRLKNNVRFNAEIVCVIRRTKQ